MLLGDSFAASVGCYKNSFVDVFCRDNSYSDDVEIHNAATFNVTSADILKHYDDYCEKNVIDLLVVALGNCDPCSYGYKKSGSVLSSPWAARMHDRKIKRKHSILKRNPPFTYISHDIDSAGVESVVPAGTFKKNLDRLLNKARKDKVPVLLFNLVANAYFPPCNNTGNRIFYKVFGLSTRHTQYSARDSRGADVVRALLLHDDFKIDAARKCYEAMLQADDERKAIAANNLAHILYHQGKFDESLAMLEVAVPASGIVSPMVLYNKAVLLKEAGKGEESELLFYQAYNEDLGSYRIKPSYQGAIRELVEGRGEVVGLDVGDVASQRDFVDYCHPGLEAHTRIASLFSDKVEQALGLKAGKHQPKSTYLAYNPDASLGYDSDFFKHMGISVVPDHNFVQSVIEQADKEYASALNALGKSCSDMQINSKTTILSHPVFGHPAFLRQVAPHSKVDQGRVSELFFLRVMIAAYAHEPIQDALKDYESIRGLIPDVGKVGAWFKCLRLHSSHVPALDRLKAVHAELPWDDIMQRAALLCEHIEADDHVADNKVNSITYWFMREALFFGAVSDASMLTRRMDVQKLVETLVFYAIGETRKDMFQQLAQRISVLIS